MKQRTHQRKSKQPARRHNNAANQQKLFFIFSKPGLYLRLAQPQLNPLQRLAEDATLLLLHTAAFRRHPALFWLLQALQQTTVLSSQCLQSRDHLLCVAQNLLRRQHGCSSEVPLQTTADLQNTRRH